jgi:hypothetical protein
MTSPVMTAILASALAQAASPEMTLEWARPFTLAAPERYTMTAERPMFHEGWLVQLRVADPARLVPLQVGQAVPYAGAVPLSAFNSDPVGGCLVAYLPGPVDLVGLPLFFGSSELPERVDAARGQQERALAEGRGVQPPSALELAAALQAGGAPLQAMDLRDVHRVAMERVALCTKTAEDLQRPGVPGR